MNITDTVSNKINRLPKGYVFTVDDFSAEVNSREATIKALNRMFANSK